MRLLYVTVTLVSAFMGFVALEAKPIEANNSVKATRAVPQTRQIVTRQTEYYEPETAQPQTQVYCSQKSCCPGNSTCTSASCRAGKSQCSGKSCGCGK